MAPRSWLESATFSDDTTINFNSNDIVIFVGPNNAGKSVALKNIIEKARDKNSLGVVIKDVSINSSGDEDELIAWLEKHCRKNIQNPSNPSFQRLGSNVHLSQAKSWWANPHDGLKELSGFFFYHLTTDARLSAANPAPNIALTRDSLTHPIHYMQVSGEIEIQLSTYFKEAFGEELIVHRNAGREVPLHCGKRPVPGKDEDRVSLGYIQALEKLPTLHTQGDGMRSFVGVLLHSFVVNHSAVLIDEPEAFLHPPQARLLGRMLVEQAPANRQMFVATHSGDFLRGILDTNTDRVRIIRIQRDGDINLVKELNNEGIKQVWGDPILRYSNILDGLFHNQVIVCEADSDCRFYAAIKDVLYQDAPDETRRHLMFLHCGGKDRIPIVAKALRTLDVPTSVIVDFDVLSNEHPLKAIFLELGGDWDEIHSKWNLVKTSIDQKKPELEAKEVIDEIGKLLSKIEDKYFPKEAKENIQTILRRSSPWAHAKTVGKSFIPSGDPTSAYNDMISQLKSKGLFVVEVGELEGFSRSIGGHGPKWVNTALEKDLLNDPELESARTFVCEFIEL